MSGNIMNKAKEIIDQVLAAQKVYADLIKENSEEFKSAILQMFKEAFEKNPTYTQAKWVQYVPSFNDGDECSFTISDVELNGPNVSENGYWEWRLPEDFKLISKLIHADYELAEAAFDNYVEITVTYDGENVTLSSEEYYE